MKQRICAVVVGKSLDIFLRNMRKAQEQAAIVELRVDTIEGMHASMVKDIWEHVSKDTIFTCRAKREGGAWKGPEQERMRCLEAGSSGGFTYVDVELSTLERRTITVPRSKTTRSIISYHNFVRTPSSKELERIVLRMQEYHPSIMKIATMVRNPRDKTRLYTVLIERTSREHLIVIGMGEAGRETRVVAPFLGSKFTYAPIGDKVSAPGQIAYGTLVEIYKKIEYLR